MHRFEPCIGNLVQIKSHFKEIFFFAKRAVLAGEMYVYFQDTSTTCA